MCLKSGDRIPSFDLMLYYSSPLRLTTGVWLCPSTVFYT